MKNSIAPKLGTAHADLHAALHTESPIGHIVCAETSREQVELLQMHKDGIAVADYWTELPRHRFPTVFLFQLTADEKTEVVANCDHLQNLKFFKALPLRLPSTEPPKRPIGFLTHEEKKTPKASTLTQGRKAP